MVRTTLGAVLALLTVLATRPAGADPIAVKYTEGITRGFPVLRALNGEKLAQSRSAEVTDVPDLKCWIAGGEAPAFLRFEGPLYFMGPIWRIDWS
jgi:hypothetical protein